MKNSKLNYLIALFSVISFTFFTSCTKDKTDTGWVVSYSGISLGDQNNHTTGHFFKPQTGEVVAVENTANQQQYLAFMFFTESSGANSFITFPADGQGASTFGTSGNRLFTQNPGGINYWQAANLVSGMVYKCSMTSVQFDNLATNVNWEKFNNAFTTNAGGLSNLEFKLHYDLNPVSGSVYLVQFNGLVRAIFCIRNVVPSSANGGSIRFDALVEGQGAYTNSVSAKYIQPAKKN